MALLTSSQILDLERLANAEDWDAMVVEMFNRVEKVTGKDLVDNVQAAKLLNVPTNTNAALDLKQSLSQKNVANGYVGLDENLLIPSIFLPSYVDDVIEILTIASSAPTPIAVGDLYYNSSDNKIYRYNGSVWGSPTDPEKGKIYVNLADNANYRWGGSVLIEISGSPGTTDEVVEGITNKYFTEARVLNTVAAGFSATNSAISASDSIISAIGKAQGQINAINTVLTTTLFSVARTWTATQTFTVDPVFSSMNAGSVLFAGAGGVLSQDNTKFRYQATGYNGNAYLLVNATASVPTAAGTFHVRGSSTNTSNFTVVFTDSSNNNIFRVRDDRAVFVDGSFSVLATNNATGTALIDAAAGWSGNGNLGTLTVRSSTAAGPRLLMVNNTAASTANWNSINFMFNVTAGGSFLSGSIQSRFINIGSGSEMGNLLFGTNITQLAAQYPSIRGGFIGDRFVIGLAADADYNNYANALARFHLRTNDALATSLAMLITNNAPADILAVHNDRRVMVAGVNVTGTPFGVGIVSGRAATIGNLDIVSSGAVSWTGVGISIAAGNRTFEFIGVAGNQINALDNNRFVFKPNGAFSNTRTSGLWNDLSFGPFNFAPTSGNAVYSGINLDLTVNQTGGANGIVRGFFANITNIASADLRAFEATTGIVLLGRMAADPSVANNGAIYYNTATNKFRGCENGTWQNII